MLFRLSQKLNAKIKAGVLAAAPLDENPFADWSAHLFVVDRTQYIFLSNTASLYSVLLYGRGITNDSEFIDRALSALREFMEGDGRDFAFRRFIAPASGTVRFAKALDRSITGSINELVAEASCWLAEGDVSPFEVGLRLNDTLLSALAEGTSESYRTPRAAFRTLVSSIKPS